MFLPAFILSSRLPQDTQKGGMFFSIFSQHCVQIKICFLSGPILFLQARQQFG
jgi:hypothetical protein